MDNRILRSLLCATAASATFAFGTPAHAIAYSVGFDPIGFGGTITIDVAPACLSHPAGTFPCTFDVTNVNFFDGAGMQWFDPDVTETGIGQKITLDSLDNITAILVDILNLEPVKGDSPCDGQRLSFALDNSVTFSCFGNADHNGEGRVIFITRAPEPTTYALLSIGLLALAASRRRRRS
jgi:hypothetical protein